MEFLFGMVGLVVVIFVLTQVSRLRDLVRQVDEIAREIEALKLLGARVEQLERRAEVAAAKTPRAMTVPRAVETPLVRPTLASKPVPPPADVPEPPAPTPTPAAPLVVTPLPPAPAPAPFASQPVKSSSDTGPTGKATPSQHPSVVQLPQTWAPLDPPVSRQTSMISPAVGPPLVTPSGTAARATADRRERVESLAAKSTRKMSET